LEQTFSDSTFYLDTNVLVVGLLESERDFEMFKELVGVARRIGIKLRVTRATINEIRRVAADRCSQLKTVLPELPTEVVEKANDQFLSAFLAARAAQPTPTPDAFFEQYDRLSEVMRDKWGFEVVENIEDEVLAAHTFAHERQVMQDSAVETRGWEKSEIVLNHDLCHFALVLDERRTNPKTWFLTRDRSLTHAASRLKRKNEQGFCFSLIGFLQSLSPFVTTPSEEHSLADVFSALLTEQLFPAEQLFDPKELMLLVEMHRDVLSTP